MRIIESLTKVVSKRVEDEIVTCITHTHQDGSESKRYTSSSILELELEEDRGHETVLARR